MRATTGHTVSTVSTVNKDNVRCYPPVNARDDSCRPDLVGW
jgi:hypothetical protein